MRAARMVGLEASPNDGVALGAYARRGLRPVDVTLRLRASAAALAASGMAAEFEVRSAPGATALDGPRLAEPGGSRTAPTSAPASGDTARVESREVDVARRAAVVPLSDAAFMAVGPGASVVCDPEAVPAGGVLEARLGFLGRDGHSIAAACRGLGRLAVARQLRYVELDLAVGSGEGAGRGVSARDFKRSPARSGWRGRRRPIARPRTMVWSSGAGRSSAMSHSNTHTMNNQSVRGEPVEPRLATNALRQAQGERARC